MKAWNKVKIKKETVAACEMESENAESEKDERYWNRCANFLTDIKEKDYDELSKVQKEWARNIKLNLKAKGYSV